MSHTTRRGLLGALGVAGLASLGSGGASAQLGGGPEADAMSEYRVPTYRVPESDLDSPGVVGRRVEITSGGSNWSAGDQLVDTGSSWELINAGVQSLSADSLNNEVLFASQYAVDGSGTATDPYVDGVRRAVESTTEPHYVIVDGVFLEDPINVLDGAFEQFREGGNAWTPPPLIGLGRRQSLIILKDGSNDHLIKYDIDAADVPIAGSGQNVGDATIKDVGIIGNKDGQSQESHGIYGAAGSNGERIVRGFFSNLMLRWCNGDGIAKSGDCFGKSTNINIDCKYNEGTGYRLFVGANGYHIVSDENTRGIAVNTAAKLFGGYVQFNNERAVNLNGGEIDSVYFHDNNELQTGDATIEIPGISEQAAIRDCHFDTINAYAIVNDQGTETRYQNMNILSDPNNIINSLIATRPHWNGVIGGGPIGGLDVGSITSADEGAVARSNGSTGDADAVYILKDSGDWQALHDPTTTITPS